MTPKIRQRERDSIIQSLRAGVTPRTGLQYIQVGRVNEIRAMVKDINCIADEGSSFKMIIGDYGAGKSFFLQLVKTIALEKGLVTMNADLAPDRRLQASSGQALNLYQELTRNMATRARPNGNALNSVIEKFITGIREENPDGEPGRIIKDRLAFLNDFVGGYDFALVIQAYWKGYDTGNDDLKNNAVKWLRGEYHTKTEARQELGVRTIVDDASIYDFFKLLSAFVQAAGYKGLLISMDEMVNLYKIHNIRSREANYEQILRIINDCMQGNVRGLGFIFGGTPDFLEDPRKGLFSYEAHCSQNIGDAYFKTPRNTIKAFVDLLSVIEQNPSLDWRKLLQDVRVGIENSDNLGMDGDNANNDAEDDDELTGVTL